MGAGAESTVPPVVGTSSFRPAGILGTSAAATVVPPAPAVLVGAAAPEAAEDTEAPEAPAGPGTAADPVATGALSFAVVDAVSRCVAPPPPTPAVRSVASSGWRFSTRTGLGASAARAPATRSLVDSPCDDVSSFFTAPAEFAATAATVGPGSIPEAGLGGVADAAAATLGSSAALLWCTLGGEATKLLGVVAPSTVRRTPLSRSALPPPDDGARGSAAMGSGSPATPF